MYVDKAEIFNSLQKARGLATVDFKDEVIYKDFLRSVGLGRNNTEIKGITDSKKIQEVKIQLLRLWKTAIGFLSL